jgi:hypothetical protein
MGHEEIETQKVTNIDDDNDDTGEVMDNRKLNDLIKNAMIGKENDRK